MPKVLLVEAQAPLGPRGRHAQGAHCQALIEQAGVSAHVRQLENGQVLGVNGRVVHWPQNVRAALAAQLALLPPHQGATAVLAHAPRLEAVQVRDERLGRPGHALAQRRRTLATLSALVPTHVHAVAGSSTALVARG